MSNLMTSRAPLLLSTSVSLAAGGGAVADAAALSTPFRKPIWVNEVRWRIQCNLSAPAAAPSPGALVSTQMRIGRAVITDGFIPIWLLAPSLQYPLYNEVINDATSSATSVVVGEHRWVLPKPLYVAPGSSVSASFQRAALSGSPFTGNMNVNVAFAGSYAPPSDYVPDNIAVPYATCWQPANGGYVISADKALENPFNVPLNVQRFTGRIWYATATADGFEDFGVTPVTAANAVTVQMKDSLGYSVIKDLTPFSYAFDVLRRAWTFQRVLAPDERFVAAIKGLPVGTSAGIGMIGWRNEVYA